MPTGTLAADTPRSVARIVTLAGPATAFGSAWISQLAVPGELRITVPGPEIFKPAGTLKLRFTGYTPPVTFTERVWAAPLGTTDGVTVCVIVISGWSVIGTDAVRATPCAVPVTIGVRTEPDGAEVPENVTPNVFELELIPVTNPEVPKVMGIG